MPYEAILINNIRVRIYEIAYLARMFHATCARELIVMESPTGANK